MNWEYYSKIKCWCIKQWKMKYLDETAFGLAIHIYWNDSHKYLALSWAYYRDKMLSRYIIKDSMKRKVLFIYRSASLLGSVSQTPLEMGYIRGSHVFDTMTTLLCTLLCTKLNKCYVKYTVYLFFQSCSLVFILLSWIFSSIIGERGAIYAYLQVVTWLYKNIMILTSQTEQRLKEIRFKV